MCEIVHAEHSRPVSITALLPAHNEATTIAHAIASIRNQTWPVDRILVACDNCTDDTAEIAASLGCDVYATVDNTGRKAGALNQALDQITSGLVLVMDADTQISPNFVATAIARLEDPRIGAVGAVFSGDQPASLLELCQSNEWQRFRRQIGRTGRVQVLSGTAALIRFATGRRIVWTHLEVSPA